MLLLTILCVLYRSSLTPPCEQMGHPGGRSARMEADRKEAVRIHWLAKEQYWKRLYAGRGSEPDPIV